MMEELLYRDRRGTNASKWNRLGRNYSRDDLMGLWVADMDFAAPACVRNALKEQAEFGVFGYDFVPDAYYDAFICWEETYHGYRLQREWLRFSPGVVSAFNWLIRIFTRPGDGVLVQTPVYHPFLHAPAANGCRRVENRLINKNGVYSVNFEDFEAKLREENIKVFLLCSPHNPVGRVWKRDELRHMLDLCKKYGVLVISDEIHQDFTFSHPHIPAALVGDYNDMLIMLTAPSKTFNLAGLKNSIVILPDETLRRVYDAFTSELHVSGGNSMGVVAAAAAYTGGREWFEAALTAVQENARILKEALSGISGVTVSPLEGTYLSWIDLSGRVRDEDLEDLVEGKCSLAVNYGRMFGSGGEGHIRINLATKAENIRIAAGRLAENIGRGACS